MNNHDDNHGDVETDPRFPSGEWSGFFLQPSFYRGRVKMSLTMSFKNGKLTGEGTDIVGDFTLRGEYEIESGEVRIHKQYRGFIGVYYKGFAEPQHKGIWGTWEIATIDRGGFRIWPRKYGEECDMTEGEEADLPVECFVVEDDLSPATADVS